MFCLICLSLLWGFDFFSGNTFYVDLSPSVWVSSVCVIGFFTSVCLYLSLKALIGESQILYPALKENKFQETHIIKLELFLPILSPFPTFIVELAWILLL